MCAWCNIYSYPALSSSWSFRSQFTFKRCKDSLWLSWYRFLICVQWSCPYIYKWQFSIQLFCLGFRNEIASTEQVASILAWSTCVGIAIIKQWLWSPLSTWTRKRFIPDSPDSYQTETCATGESVQPGWKSVTCFWMNWKRAHTSQWCPHGHSIWG